MPRTDHRNEINNTMVYISRDSDHAKNTRTYAVNNLSRGGLQFSSSDNFRVDEHLTIKLDFGNGNTHCAHARICYCLKKSNNTQDFDYGISYLGSH